MSYAEQRGDPRKYSLGLAAVVGFHVLLAYALANGLARKVVDVLKSPLDVSLIEEVKVAPPPPPPPPPPKVVRTPPKVAAPPPPAYVPPEEVPVAPAPEPVIAVTTAEPPPPEPVVAPEPAPQPAPKPAPPPIVDVAVTCPNHVAVRSRVAYPPQAERMGLSGDVVVDFTVGADGAIRNVAIARSTNAVFNSAATAAVAKLNCVGQGHDVRVRLPFSFRLD